MTDDESLPSTEERDPHERDLDLCSTPDLVVRLIEANARALDAVRAAAPAITRAVDAIAASLQGGNRLHYVGAGTSGRLATLDAAELPPTFGTSPDLVLAHVAGGLPALVHAVEGAEDDAGAGETAMESSVVAGDVVIGISASGGAPFVVAAIAAAQVAGAATIALTSVADSPLARAADDAIVIDSGPEPIAGSTRLRAGTAQKIVLNAISTAVMVRLEKVFDVYMVDLVATNAKLRARATRLVQTIAGVDDAVACELLHVACGSVKTAVVMAQRHTDVDTARQLLAAEHGSLRRAGAFPAVDHGARM